jgi:hypothetical protein
VKATRTASEASIWLHITILYFPVNPEHDGKRPSAKLWGPGIGDQGRSGRGCRQTTAPPGSWTLSHARRWRNAASTDR